MQLLKLVIHFGKFNIEKECNRRCDTDMQKNSWYDISCLEGLWICSDYFVSYYSLKKSFGNLMPVFWGEGLNRQLGLVWDYAWIIFFISKFSFFSFFFLVVKVLVSIPAQSPLTFPQVQPL